MAFFFFFLVPLSLFTLIPPTSALNVSVGGGIGIGIGGNPTPTPTPNPTPNPVNCPPPPLPLIFADQRLAAVYPVIQKFKKTITCDNLGISNSWSGSDICNKYKGFYCEAPPDNASAITVASVDFNGYGLCAPSINDFLGNMPDLALFHANSNNLTGTISPKIATLPYLYEFDISNNRFTGPFPSALMGPNNITFLDLRFNTFSGSVPPQIFTGPRDVLFLNNNNFMMNIPDNLGLTPVLYLTLANNKFTGQIPRSIGKACATLTEILLLNNQLSGCLPYEIGYLTALTLFDAGNNRLTGPIPCSFACLSKVEQVNLAGNLLYGMVPEVVCGLQNLQNLSLSDNYFTQVGPICRKLIESGVLDLRKNCIPNLPGQRSWGECAMFFSRPRSCPFMQSYGIIPCRGSSQVHGSGSVPSWMTTRGRKTMSSFKDRKITYSALNQRR